MEEIKIVILGNPVSQLRPIFNSHTKRAVDPKKCRDYKNKVALTAKKYVGIDWELLNEPLKVRMDFYREIPKSWSKKKTQQAINGELLPVTKPDIDNYVKAVLDGISGVVWKDDNMIVEIVGRKHYSNTPRVEVVITGLND